MCRTNYSVWTGYPNFVSKKSPQSPDAYVFAINKKSGDINVKKTLEIRNLKNMADLYRAQDKLKM